MLVFGARGLRFRYAFHVDGRVFEVDVADGSCTIHQDAGAEVDATITSDSATLFAMRRRELTPRQALASKKVHLEGDAKALGRFVDVFAWSTERLAQAGL